MIASHCNDSKVDLGAKRDRHEHLGKGHIGIEAFRHFVQHPKLQHIDLILETPFTKEGGDDDPRLEDMMLLKKFRKK